MIKNKRSGADWKDDWNIEKEQETKENIDNYSLI